MLILSDDVENKNFPVVNTLLILINIGVLVWMFANNHFTETFFRTWATVPGRFTAHPGIEQFQFLLYSMFMHGGIMHLLGNMWALYLFGDNVEDRLGHWTYLVFYLLCGFSADLLHIFSDPFSMQPCVGASGAIAGIMGAYLVLHPHATCKTWWGDDSLFLAFRTIRIPAVFVIGGWFVLQVVFSQMFGGSTHIAYWAHIGGFLAGIGLLLVVQSRFRGPAVDDETASNGLIPAISLAVLLIVSLHLLNPYLPKVGQAADAKEPKIVETETKPVAPAPKKKAVVNGSAHKQSRKYHKTQRKHARARSNVDTVTK